MMQRVARVVSYSRSLLWAGITSQMSGRKLTVSKQWKKHKSLTQANSLASSFLHPPQRKCCCSLCVGSLASVP